MANEAPKIGLDNVVIARVISDDASGIVYDTPIALKGAVNATVNPNSDVAVDYADNGPFFSASNRGNTELNLEMIDVDPTVLALMLGQAKANGVTLETVLDQSPDFAVGFRVWLAGKDNNGNNRYQYFWYAKGKFSVPETGGSTKTESIEFGHINLTAQFAQTIYNGIICTHARNDDDETPASVITNWFNAPVTSVSADLTALTVTASLANGKVTFTGVKASSEDFVFVAGSVINGQTIGVLDALGALMAGSYSVDEDKIVFTPSGAGTPTTAFVTNGLKDNNGVGATPMIDSSL